MVKRLGSQPVKILVWERPDMEGNKAFYFKDFFV